MRKEPTQTRAKQRVSRILDATESLVIEEGVSSLTVHSIADRAEVPIGSLYQYFTNRDEVLKALCKRHFSILDARLSGGFKDVRSAADFLRDVRQALTVCWDYTRYNEGFRHLFFGVQFWEIMREADLQDTFVNAQRVSEALQGLAPLIPPRRILALCVLIGDASSGTARLANRFEDLREELFTEFLDLVESRIYTLMRDNTALERTASHTIEPVTSETRRRPLTNARKVSSRARLQLARTSPRS